MSLNATSNYRIRAEVQGTSELDRFGRSIRNVATDAKDSEKSIGGVFGSLQSQLQALGLAVGVGALTHFARQALDAAGGIGELSEQLGVSSRLLQGLQYAGTQAGVSTGQLEAGLARLTRTIGDAAGGSKSAIDTFNALGVGVLDAAGKVRTTEDVLLDVARSLSEIDDPARRAAVVVDIFGKSGQRLLPLLGAGEAGVRAFIAEAQRMGAILSDDAIGAADKAADKLSGLEFRLKKLAEQAAATVAGPLNSFFDWLDEFNAREAETSAKVRAAIGNIQLLEDAEAAVKSKENELSSMDAARANAGALGFIGTVFGQSQAEFDAERKAVVDALEQARQNLARVQYVASLGQSPGRAFPGQRAPTAGTYNPKPKGDGSTKADPEAAALEAMRQQFQAAQKLTAEETVLAEIESGRYAKFSAATQEKLLAYAREIDLVNEIEDDHKAAADAAKKGTEEAKRQADEQDRLARQVEKQLAGYRARAQAIGLSAQEAERVAFAEYLTAQGFAAGTEAFQKFVADYDAAIGQIEARQGDWKNGARSALLDYATGAKDVAGQVRDAFSNGFQGLEDALVQFTMTGKLSFRSFAQSVLADLARILIRSQLLGPIAGVLGGMFSGGAGVAANAGFSMAQFGARAAGGNVTAGVPYVVGEKRPELFVPGRSGTIVPSAAGMGAIDVDVSVVVNRDGGTTTESNSDGPEGKALGEKLGGMVKGIIANEMRPGGLLQRAAQ